MDREQNLEETLVRDSSSRLRSSAPANSNIDTDTFRFLDLPPELRNSIYRLLLVTPKPSRINLNGADARQPSLLRESKQFRSETTSIYYGENVFDFNVRDMQGTAMIPFRKLLLKYRTSRVHRNFYLRIRGAKNWSNLFEWLKASYGNDRLACMMTLDCDRKVKKVVVAAFRIVLRLKDQPWSQVEGVLKEYRRTVTALDGGWV